MYHPGVRRTLRLLLLGTAAIPVVVACRSATEFPFGGGGTNGVVSAVAVRARMDGLLVRWDPVSDAVGYRVCLVEGSGALPAACDEAGAVMVETTGSSAFVNDTSGGPVTVFVAAQVGNEPGPFAHGLTARTFPRGHAGYRPRTMHVDEFTGPVGSLFGGRMAEVGDLDGDGYEDLLVGAPYYQPGNRGRAYLFRGGAAGLGEPQIVENPVPAVEYFGISVGHSGGYGGAPGVLVGARGVESGGAGTEGHAYLFTVLGTALEPASLDFESGTNQGDAFGYASVAYRPTTGSNPILVMGAYEDDTSTTNGGCLYAFLAGTNFAWYECPASTARLGQALANLGDVDGTAGDELAAQHGGGTTNPRVRVYGGLSGGGLNPPPSKDLLPPVAGASDFGFTAVGLDFDGDGLREFAIGARAEASNRGTVYVYRRTGDQVPEVPLHGYTGGAAAGDRLASAMAAGDVNGDGYDDLLVGAPRLDDAGGEAFLWLGGPGGLGTDGAWSVSGSEVPQLGNGVALVDLNGDGSKDVVVGAAGTGTAACRIYWYPGPPLRGPDVRLQEGAGQLEVLLGDASPASDWTCTWMLDGMPVPVVPGASCAPGDVAVPQEIAAAAAGRIELVVSNEYGPTGHAFLIRAAD